MNKNNDNVTFEYLLPYRYPFALTTVSPCHRPSKHRNRNRYTAPTYHISLLKPPSAPTTISDLHTEPVRYGVIPACQPPTNSPFNTDDMVVGRYSFLMLRQTIGGLYLPYLSLVSTYDQPQRWPNLRSSKPNERKKRKEKGNDSTGIIGGEANARFCCKRVVSFSRICETFLLGMQVSGIWAIQPTKEVPFLFAMIRDR